MRKKVFKYSTALLIVTVSLVSAAGLGVFHYFYNPVISESSAGSLSVNFLRLSWTWYGNYGVFNTAWSVSSTTAYDVIRCSASESPQIGSGGNSYLGDLGQSRSPHIGNRPTHGARENMRYTVTLDCKNMTTGQTISATRQKDTVLPSGGCFTAGTRVTMADGSSKNIQDVKVGDSVLSSEGPVKVSQTFRHAVNPEPIYLINGSLAATANHPVNVNGGWVRVDELKVGDQLSGGQTVTSLEKTDRSEPVYNLEVDGPHDYFANGVLVHNKANF